MSKELTTKLQGIIKQAAQTLPAQTGKVAAQQAKIDRRRGQAVILADVSDSMQDLVGENQRKIDILREAVAVARSKSSARLMVFSDQAREVESIPEPEANTNLTAGLKAALAHDPGVTLVISDGQPDRPDEALAIARQFRGVIDVLYIGPDSDLDAIAFMRRLAAAAGGGGHNERCCERRRCTIIGRANYWAIAIALKSGIRIIAPLWLYVIDILSFLSML